MFCAPRAAGGVTKPPHPHSLGSGGSECGGTARRVRRRRPPLGAAMLYGRRMPGRRGRPVKGAAGAAWPRRGTRDGRRVGEREEAEAAPRDGGGRRAHCECLPCSATPCPLPPPGVPLPPRCSFSGAGAPRNGRSRSRRCPGGAGGILFPALCSRAARALVAGSL